MCEVCCWLHALVKTVLVFCVRNCIILLIVSRVELLDRHLLYRTSTVMKI